MATLYRRNGRTNAEIANLENYVAQVREAYQNHLDLRMNRSMMALTVLAAIFLPLSLIVGWYGMNFPMPEFSWRWGDVYKRQLPGAWLPCPHVHQERPQDPGPPPRPRP